MKASKDTPGSTALDTSTLLLRLAVGPMLVAHGYNKVFGAGGLAGTTRWFKALGLRPAALHARLAAATEITAGAAVTLGVASPYPAAAAIGLMTTAAATDHRGKGFFVFKGGWEYTAVVAAVCAAIATLGPGRVSVDALRGSPRSGLRWGLLACGLGAASAKALLAACYRPDATDPAGQTPVGVPRA
jgi:putative oxidoreductase